MGYPKEACTQCVHYQNSAAPFCIFWNKPILELTIEECCNVGEDDDDDNSD
jgi:hypothetical protein